LRPRTNRRSSARNGLSSANWRSTSIRASTMSFTWRPLSLISDDRSQRCRRRACSHGAQRVHRQNPSGPFDEKRSRHNRRAIAYLLARRYDEVLQALRTRAACRSPRLSNPRPVVREPRAVGRQHGALFPFGIGEIRATPFRLEPSRCRLVGRSRQKP